MRQGKRRELVDRERQLEPIGRERARPREDARVVDDRVERCEPCDDVGSERAHLVEPREVARHRRERGLAPRLARELLRHARGFVRCSPVHEHPRATRPEHPRRLAPNAVGGSGHEDGLRRLHDPPIVPDSRRSADGHRRESVDGAARMVYASEPRRFPCEPYSSPSSSPPSLESGRRQSPNRRQRPPRPFRSPRKCTRFRTVCASCSCPTTRRASSPTTRSCASAAATSPSRAAPATRTSSST